MKKVERTERGIKVRLAHYTDNGGDWVAEIVDFHPTYKFNRQFLNAEKDWSSSGRTGWSYFELVEGRVYEVNEPYRGRWFVQVVNGEIVELTKEDVEEYLYQKNENPEEEYKPVVVDTADEVYEADTDGTMQKLEPEKKVIDKAHYKVASRGTYIIVTPIWDGGWKIYLYVGGAARFQPKSVRVEEKPIIAGKHLSDVLADYPELRGQ